MNLWKSFKNYHHWVHLAANTWFSNRVTHSWFSISIRKSSPSQFCNSRYCIITSWLPRRSSSASLCGCSPISRLFKHVCNAKERPTLCLWHVTPSEQDCHIASMVKNILDCPLENSFWISGKFDEYIWTGPEFPFEFESVIDISEPWVRCKLSEFYGA